MSFWNGMDNLNYKALLWYKTCTTYCTYLSKKALKVPKSFPNLTSTQNGIQSCCLHQLKWNLLLKNNKDMRIITLSNHGISFQFRLVMKSFFCNTLSARFICVSVSFEIQVIKHELIYVCFLNIDCTYLHEREKMKVREFTSHISLFPKVISLKLFLVHFQLQKFQNYFIFQLFFLIIFYKIFEHS